MAKIDLKFLDAGIEGISIKVMSDFGHIHITTDVDIERTCIVLDKSTAIKFAKTLRTEINKIKS